MNKHRIQFTKSSAKELEKIAFGEQNRIISSIEKLSSNPFPSGVKRLVGSPFYRIRVGNYRIIYEVSSDTVTIMAIGHRKDVYR